VEVVLDPPPGGVARAIEYRVDGVAVAHRWFDEDGSISCEWPLRNGVRSGVAYEFHGNGAVERVVEMVGGREEGLCLQWNVHGTLLGWYLIEKGCGWDLWWQDYLSSPHLAEARQLRDGMRHGPEWWFHPDLYQESFFHEGEVHGIERSWRRVKLARGYPRFWIHGRRVRRDVYARAAATDPTLIPYRPEEDAPDREFPEIVREARALSRLDRPPAEWEG
jgi:hypothetical protein